jgi:hypothetical protein
VPPAAGRPEKRDQSPSRVSIIKTITSPLGFFALITLIIEAILALFAARVDGLNLTILLCGMLLALFSLIALVAYLLIKKRESVLDSIRPESAVAEVSSFQQLVYTITLGPPDDMQNLSLARISWDLDKCIVRCADTEVNVKPAFGHGGFEVRLPPKVLAKISDTETLQLQLVDRKGLQWEVRPFFLRTVVSLSYLCSEDDVKAAYGSAE